MDTIRIKDEELTVEERLAEQIALMLLELPPHPHEPERTYEIVVNQALDLARRAQLGWWQIPGKPHYNGRLARIKEAWKGARKLRNAFKNQLAWLKKDKELARYDA